MHCCLQDKLGMQTIYFVLSGLFKTYDGTMTYLMYKYVLLERTQILCFSCWLVFMLLVWLLMNIEKLLP